MFRSGGLLMKILIALVILAMIVGALVFGFRSQTQVSAPPKPGAASASKMEDGEGRGGESEKSAPPATSKPSAEKASATPQAATAKKIEFPSPLPPPAMAPEPAAGTASPVDPEEMARRIAARQLQAPSDPKQASPTPQSAKPKK